jgi:hypothetical protein
VFIASTGIPETYGLVPTNYKTEKLNYFTSTGYNYRTTQGGGLTAEYFNPDGSTNKYIGSRNTERKRISTRSGVEWTINPTTFPMLLIIEKILEG